MSTVVRALHVPQIPSQQFSQVLPRTGGTPEGHVASDPSNSPRHHRNQLEYPSVTAKLLIFCMMASTVVSSDMDRFQITGKLSVDFPLLATMKTCTVILVGKLVMRLVMLSDEGRNKAKQPDKSQFLTRLFTDVLCTITVNFIPVRCWHILCSCVLRRLTFSTLVFLTFRGLYYAFFDKFAMIWSRIRKSIWDDERLILQSRSFERTTKAPVTRKPSLKSATHVLRKTRSGNVFGAWPLPSFKSHRSLKLSCRQDDEEEPRRCASVEMKGATD